MLEQEEDWRIRNAVTGRFFAKSYGKREARYSDQGNENKTDRARAKEQEEELKIGDSAHPLTKRQLPGTVVVAVVNGAAVVAVDSGNRGWCG